MRSLDSTESQIQQDNQNGDIIHVVRSLCYCHNIFDSVCGIEGSQPVEASHCMHVGIVSFLILPQPIFEFRSVFLGKELLCILDVSFG
jgi:hypothetical protein